MFLELSSDKEYLNNNLAPIKRMIRNKTARIILRGFPDIFIFPPLLFLLNIGGPVGLEFPEGVFMLPMISFTAFATVLT
jgi:hypothetical protein